MASIFGNITSILADIGFTGMDAAFTSQGMGASTLDEVVEQGKNDDTVKYAAEIQNEYVNGPRQQTSPLIGPASSGSSSSFSLISSIVCVVLAIAVM
jgi:hypothetical protein